MLNVSHYLVQITALPEPIRKLFLPQAANQAMTISASARTPMPAPAFAAAAKPPVRLDRVPAELLSLLLPFQRDGVLFAVGRGGR